MLIGRRLLSVRRHLLAIEAAADRAQAGHWASAGRALQEELRAAQVDLLALRAEVEPLFPLCPYAAWLPRFGGDIQFAPELLDMGLGIVGAGQAVFEGMGPLLLAFQTDVSTETLQDMGMHTLLAARPQLLTAQAEVERAIQARQRIQPERLSAPMARLVGRLDNHLPLAQFAVQGALLAPSLLGMSGGKHYLILAQNEDELRATGGFISGVGLLQVEEGRVSSLTFQDSYAIGSKAEADPPDALEKTMQAQIWLLRDANWSPDFPTAAELAIDIYERDQGVSLDGVIAADQQAMLMLLDALGPVEVDGWDRPVTSDTFVSMVREAWAPKEQNPGEWWPHRKDFMGAIADALAHKLEVEAESTDFLKLGRAIRQALHEQHILLYLREPQAAEVLAANHWDGAILPAECDYLMVVDSNVGFNKANPNVEQGMEYHVRIRPDGTIRSELSLTYINRSTRQVSECIQEARYDATYTYEGMMDRCYWNYLRVYVPRGVVLMEGTRNPLPPGSLYRRMTGEEGGTGEPTLEAGEGGKTVLASFFVVPPQQSRKVEFTYGLPGRVQPQGGHREYSLLIQKQPGTLQLPARVTIELPYSAEVLATHPEPSGTEDSVLEYDLLLSTTQELKLVFH